MKHAQGLISKKSTWDNVFSMVSSFERGANTDIVIMDQYLEYA